MDETPGTLGEPAGRAGEWLGLSATTATTASATATAASASAATTASATATAASASAATTASAASERHTAVIVADRFDRITWRDTFAQSAGLRELAAELTERYDHTVDGTADGTADGTDCTADLLTDAFLAAYKVRPRLRERAEMDPSRLFNHQVVTALVESAEFAELHRETAADPYAAAMAVLAQAAALRRMLDHSRDAREQAGRAAKAQRAAERAATAVSEALQRAAEGTADAADAEAANGSDDGTANGSDDRAADGSDDRTADGSDKGDTAVPDPAATATDADAVQQAIEAAVAAEAAARQAAQGAAQALAVAAPGIRSAARNAAAKAARGAREEAALMRAWGVGPGELERMPFDERARLAERLRTGRLARWAELIGRFRQMAGGERARKVENASGELVGVTLGDDLSRVIPSELANLGLPELRAVFAARYAAGELMLYDSQGEQTTGLGAIIACVDTSHSMYEAGPGGVTREAWAKACALALLDQARHAGRDFVGILFAAADKLQVFRFPAGEPAGIARTLDFAETFLGGGTSYQRPLTAAATLLEEEFNDAARMRGDIVMLTDDDCGVTEEWMRGWNDAKHRLGFRVFGVAIGAPRVGAAGSVLEALCDNLRAIEDLTDVHAAADLFRVI